MLNPICYSFTIIVNYLNFNFQASVTTEDEIYVTGTGPTSSQAVIYGVEYSGFAGHLIKRRD